MGSGIRAAGWRRMTPSFEHCTARSQALRANGRATRASAVAPIARHGLGWAPGGVRQAGADIGRPGTAREPERWRGPVGESLRPLCPPRPRRADPPRRPTGACRRAGPRPIRGRSAAPRRVRDRERPVRWPPTVGCGRQVRVPVGSRGRGHDHEPAEPRGRTVCAASGPCHSTLQQVGVRTARPTSCTLLDGRPTVCIL